jgi:hypothetical protein
MTMYPLIANRGRQPVERPDASGVALGSVIGIIVIIQEARP